ncbi:ABC transporter ATP-binding protein [Bacillus vallismortis]|uniref:ABC transporter ATP-binding protein n=1 Tax=Bacillus TaxID=1386 RepID=UPI00057BDBC7|nr:MULTISPECIES: dipeptide ABC transporter ATP-binding protein [Bacillus]PJZ02200.1 ABC transporter ATP-binding protein [Bacillus vallismortis]
MNHEPLVEVKHLKKIFSDSSGLFKKSKAVRAVDDISFTINRGETFGLVGESGCGKSTTGRMLMKLLEPTEGSILFNGQDITNMNEKDVRNLRKDFQMVFQDPYASLNPRMRVKEIIEEPLIVHGLMTSSERERKVHQLLDTVGLSRQHGSRFPHEFSGGQRQRIGIARALAVNPKLIIADEAVSALDVSIQSQILNLMKDLQKEFGLTYLFIAHDLSVVDFISDRIGVMYLGKLVEVGDRDSIIQNPKHPYTKALLSAVPIPDPHRRKERIELKGDLPSPSNPPAGCPFHTRCPAVMDQCKTEMPMLSNMSEQHQVFCHLYDSKK